MKLVVVADVHLHPWRLCSRDGGHDRLMDGLSVLRQSLDLAKELKATWVFCGDMKIPKNQWPQSALTGALAVLREYDDVIKVMVAGNHDAWGEGGTGLAPFRDCAVVVEKPQIVDECDAVCAPWDADLSVVRKLLEGGYLLVAHGFLQGCMLGAEDARIAKGTPAADYGDFSVAFFGDVHKGQWRRPASPPKPPEWLAYVEGVKIREAGPWRREIYYAGSPYQQNWGERNDPPKGALVVDLETGEVELRALRSPRYRHFELGEGDLLSFIRNQGAYKGDFMRVVYTGRPSEILDEIRRVGESFRSFQLIERRPERSEYRVDVHAGMATPDLIRSYVGARPPVDLDAAKTLEAGVRLVTP